MAKFSFFEKMEKVLEKGSGPDPSPSFWGSEAASWSSSHPSPRFFSSHHPCSSPKVGFLFCLLGREYPIMLGAISSQSLNRIKKLKDQVGDLFSQNIIHCNILKLCRFLNSLSTGFSELLELCIIMMHVPVELDSWLLLLFIS